MTDTQHGNVTPGHNGQEVAINEAAMGIGPQRAEQLRGRWTALKGEFVDEPKRAVHGARDLTGDVLDELERSLRAHHTQLAGGIGENASTEELRVALGRYHKLCERLLAF
ncbi:MAG TPA: hypothetical protein VGH89_19765 [Pseudonocardia sp.]|jgi:hypothetical protein